MENVDDDMTNNFITTMRDYMTAKSENDYTTLTAFSQEVKQYAAQKGSDFNDEDIVEFMNLITLESK